jgi:predicted HicB family RNase H-like nuclease
MKNQTPDPKALARRYLKVIEWSDEDGCYIGSAPPIIGQCCHGATEAAVLAHLHTIVEEWVKIFLRDGRPLPEGTAGKQYSGKFLVRIAPELHQKAALKAAAREVSLNEFVATALERS